MSKGRVLALRLLTWGLLSISLAGLGCASFISTICNLTIGDVRTAVQHGNNCAYPGLVTLPSGSLLTAYACPSLTIQTAISKDNGATWTPSSSIHFNGSVDSLSLLPNGIVFLSTSSNPVSQIGVPTFFLGEVNSDGSITWSAPHTVETPGWSKGCWAVSPLVNAGGNRLLWPVWCYNNETGGLPGSSTVLVSPDGGSTWNQQITVADGEQDNRDYDESAAVAYPDGEIVMIIRHTDSGDTDRYGSYWCTHSLDRGNTWSAPKKVAAATLVGRPGLALLRSGALVLVGRAKTVANSSTGYAVSRDRGLIFSFFADLGFDMRDTFDQYDATAVLPDDSVGVVTVHSNPDGLSTNIDYRNLVDECPAVPNQTANLPEEMQGRLDFASLLIKTAGRSMNMWRCGLRETITGM